MFVEQSDESISAGQDRFTLASVDPNDLQGCRWQSYDETSAFRIS